MDYYDYLNRLHKVLRDAQIKQPGNSEVGVLAAETWRRLVADTHVVFAEPAPGYMLIGVEGQEALFQHPGLAGLQDAWRIFMYGATAGDILHASKLDGSPSGTALGNRLKTAASWVETEAKCPELAQAMRSPSIEVSRDGSIRYNPARRQPIRLFTS